MKAKALAVLALAFSCASCVIHIAPGTLDGFMVADRANAKGPKVLVVIAHPDDETGFAATLFKTNTFLDGACDVAVITNGEGGFKYATLAESLYGYELTDESIGRAHLPAIRQQEMASSALLLHVRELFFLGQKDHRYTLDPNEVLAPDAGVWDLAYVRKRLHEIVERGHYDFVVVLAPTPDTHAHHKAASILALETVESLPANERPIVLAARAVDAGAKPLETLPDFPITALAPGAEPFVFDRLQKFGYQDKLDYRILVNWVIAVHFSQGTMQLAMNQGEREEFYLFALDGEGAREKTGDLFERLSKPQFPSKSYGESAGVAR